MTATVTIRMPVQSLQALIAHHQAQCDSLHRQTQEGGPYTRETARNRYETQSRLLAALKEQIK